MSAADSREEFVAYLAAELRRHRRDFTDDDARELAEHAASTIPDDRDHRLTFLAVYQGGVREHEAASGE